jgi:hypothetical protein
MIASAAFMVTMENVETFLPENRREKDFLYSEYIRIGVLNSGNHLPQL